MVYIYKLMDIELTAYCLWWLGFFGIQLVSNSALGARGIELMVLVSMHSICFSTHDEICRKLKYSDLFNILAE
jgi:hypothetical protein